MAREHEHELSNTQTKVSKNQFSFTRQQKLLIVETGGEGNLFWLNLIKDEAVKKFWFLATSMKFKIQS